ncbi:M28 family peptidase [Virgibacillus byunsanensis]|uniref:M28 family peptidase n=1 Tax=Virgibacillus byunsanensis TaxID=570945 RepID=A0ABW3LJR1_9BACI
MKTKLHEEKQVINDINLEIPKRILSKFSKLIRESGSDDEKIAASYLTSYLEEWEVPHQVHYPKLYLSVPKDSSLQISHPIEKNIRAKVPSFSKATEKQCSGEIVYIQSKKASKIEDIFSGGLIEHDEDSLKDKIVLTEGYPMPGQVSTFQESNAKAAIFISPGQRIHEGICTPVWGSPDLDSMDNEPHIPVLSISKEDGELLKKICEQDTAHIKFETNLDKGWFDCPLIDIFIPGTVETDKYVLLHGHLDSWHEGIGDNATGNAALLEIARVLHKNKDKIKRSIRIAIWPGHSTGRYAGSTWFADQYALDLDENCIAQVNCDSPGCRWATSYSNINWMSEADEFCKKAIKDVVGQDSSGSRPRRSGDYSFNNIGITSYYKLSSTMPDELIKEKGYHPVGGCGGNIEWHTEDDLLHIVDYDILKKDIELYLVSVFRVLNKPIYPFNYVNTIDEIINTIQQYQQESGSHFNFDLALHEAEQLKQSLTEFYQNIEYLKGESITDIDVQKQNNKLLKLGRILITMNYSRSGKFRQDPALEVPPLPDIAPALTLQKLQPDSHLYNVTKNHLTRGQNRIIFSLRKVKEILKTSN